MKGKTLTVAVAAMLLAAVAARANVFNMGPGPTSLEFVTVGNPGNAGNPQTGYGVVDYTYRIGKYEVTTGQYTDFLNAVAGTDTYALYDTSMWGSPYGCKIERGGSGTHQDPYTYSVASDWANRPVNYVSWGDAARFANWLTNGQPTGAQDASTTEDGAYYLNGATSGADLNAVTRKPGAQGGRYYLPSEAEWYKAAYHKNDGVTGNYFDVPTSAYALPGRDVTEGTNPGNNANYYSNDYVIGSPYYRTEVGMFNLSDSPYGTFDQGGNVCEWNEAVIGDCRGLRGGSFYFCSDDLYASYRSYYGGPSGGGFVIGFRIAYVPEPASLSLLALGGVAVMRRRKVNR